MDVHYSDDSVESTFPTDTVTGLNRWADILYDFEYSGAVDEVPASPRGFVHQYHIDINSNKNVESIVMRDKFDGMADYTILAMTGYVPEPSTLSLLLVLSGLWVVAYTWRRRNAAAQGISCTGLRREYAQRRKANDVVG